MADDKTPAGNGRVFVLDPRPPMRPAILDLPKLDRPSWEDLARAYAGIAANDYQHKQAQYAELDQMRFAIVQLDSNMGQLKDEVKEAIVEAILHTPLPPVRPAMPSTHESAERVAVRVRKRFEKESLNPESPNPTPDDLERMIAEGVAKELAAQKQISELQRLADLDTAAKKAREDQEAATKKAREDAAEADRRSKEDLRTQKRNWIVITTSGIVLLLIGAAFTIVQQRAVAHDQGVAEGQAKVVGTFATALATPAPPAIATTPSDVPPAPAAPASMHHH